MPRRIYSDLPKFKRIHERLMTTLRVYDDAIGEIDKALEGRRTAPEREVLQTLRRTCLSQKKQAADTIMDFRDDVNHM